MEFDKEWLALFEKSKQKTVVIKETIDEITKEIKQEKDILTSENFFERPVLGKILILQRRNAQLFEYSKPWACISVSDSYSDCDAEILEKNRLDCLRLKFDDTEYDVEKLTNRPISLEHAIEIVEFTKKVWDKVDLLMIHCNAGVSRSPAIGKFISKHFQPKYENYFDQLYSPNKLVLKRLAEAWDEH